MQTSIICFKMKALLYLLPFMLVSCDKDCVEKSNISFAKEIQPMFTQSCAVSGCHSENDQASALDLSEGNAYISLKQQGLTDSLQAERSMLYVRMNDKKNPMPPSGKLSKCDIMLVLQWLKEGAKNN